jgi:hypothetical protein
MPRDGRGMQIEAARLCEEVPLNLAYQGFCRPGCRARLDNSTFSHGTAAFACVSACRFDPFGLKSAMLLAPDVVRMT